MKSLPYYLTKFVCWLVFRIRFGLEVRGHEHVPAQGAFIVASNHVSFLDPPLVGVACPRRLTFMARTDLFDQPLLAAFLKAVRVISVHRGEADLPAVRAAVATLRAGEPVAIFPEGGRQAGGRLGTAKRGVGLLAEVTQVPIVPVLVQGTAEALPRGSRRLHRAKIRVAFGPPIAYTEPSVSPSLPGGRRSDEPAGDGARRRRHEALAMAVTEAWRRLEEQMKGSPA